MVRFKYFTSEVKVSKRKNMSYSGSKQLFKKTAGLNKIHPKNSWASYNMRGGIRL